MHNKKAGDGIPARTDRPQSDGAFVNPLGTEKIGILLTRFAIPSIIAMLVGALYNIVDQIFIGQGIGYLANAATNVAFPLVTISMAIALLIGIGGASNFNLNLGAGRPEVARRIAGNAVFLMCTVSVLLLILVRAFLEPLMLLFGATDQVLEYSMTYTGITSYGLPFLILTSAGGHLARADGSPRYTMFFTLIGAIINTILDPLFIFGFNWGIAGAAWATVIGQAVSGVMAIAYLCRMRTVRLRLKDLIPEAKSVLAIASLGMASSINQLAMMVVQIAMNNTLTYYGAQSDYGAEAPLAAAGIIAKVGMIFFALVIGVSQGSQPIIGFNYGAKNFARVRRTYFTSAVIVTLISTAGFICFQIFPRQIIGIFGAGSASYYVFAERYFRIYLFMNFLNGLQPLTSTFFTSIGKAVKGAFLSLTRQIIFLLPLILILPPIFGIDGLMYAGPIADFFAALLAALLIFFEMRLMKKQEGLAAG